MKEKEIELWEEKAMSGTLRNGSTLTSMLSKMRNALIGSVGKDGPSLKDIGTTTLVDYLEHGKLVINEDDLKAAISADPIQVHELFSKDVSKDFGETFKNNNQNLTGVELEAALKSAKASELGFARRLRQIVDDSQKIIGDRARKVGAVNDTFTLGRSLKDMNNQIDRFEARLQSLLETAIHRANSQYASLMNAFGGM